MEYQIKDAETGEVLDIYGAADENEALDAFAAERGYTRGEFQTSRRNLTIEALA